MNSLAQFAVTVGPQCTPIRAAVFLCAAIFLVLGVSIIGTAQQHLLQRSSTELSIAPASLMSQQQQPSLLSDASSGVNRRFELQAIEAGEHEKLSNPLLYLPPPPTRFPLHTRLVLRSSGHSHSLLSRSAPRVLVVGDIHGCFDELQALLKASGMDAERGDVVVAVGDLVTKGPKSKEVIQWLRENGHFAVLGNHDQMLLKNALLGGRLDSNSYANDAAITLWDADSPPTAEQQSSAEYARTYYARMNGFHLEARNDSEHYAIAQSMSKEDLEWVASLPISIDLSEAFQTQPAAASSSSSSTSEASTHAASDSSPVATSAWTVVHAGLVPSIPLLSQHPYHVTTMRNFVADDASASSSSHAHGHAHGHRDPAAAAIATLLPSETTNKGRAWSMREGDPVAPPSGSSKEDSDSSHHRAPIILFGHDAPRGFQYPNRVRVGLDTGACNGLFLTGLRLPDESVWSVQSTSSRVPGNSDFSHVRPPPQPSGVQIAKVECSKPAIAEGTETKDLGKGKK